MQLATHQARASIGTVAREQRMSVDLDAIAHIIKPLTDLYSDRILAFVREYSTNAWDSHARAGVELPIEVTLPTHDTPYFQVQDFGLGLSADDLADIYSVYGKSLNRGSELAAGTFGFGSKSALAYGDDFTIIAIKDGVRNVVQVEKDNDGIGVLKFLDQRATTEGNGVTVRIPVRMSDRHTIVDTAQGFYKYWDQGTVKLNGEVVDSVWQTVENGERTIVLDEDVYVTRSASWGRSDDHVIVMGQVPYPVRSSDIKGLPDGISVTARVPMGAVTFTPSREALKINESATLDTFKELVSYVKSMLLVKAQEELRTATDPWSRLLVWKKLTETWGMALPDEFGYKQASYYARTAQRSAAPQGWEYVSHQRRTYAIPNIFNPVLANPTRLVVVNYPFQAMSPASKARIANYCDEQGFARKATVLVSNPAWLEGHPNVVKYDDLPVIKREKVDRPKSQGYTWYVYDNQGKVRSYESFTPEGKVIAYRDHMTPAYLNQTPNVHYALLRANQVDKFKRTFPQARKWDDLYLEAAKAATANLTEDDRIYYASINTWAWRGVIPGWESIVDPELRKVMAVVKAGASRTYSLAVQFNSNASALSGFDLPAILNRYPLIGTWSGAVHPDAVIYINSKYTTTIKPQEGTAS